MKAHVVLVNVMLYPLIKTLCVRRSLIVAMQLHATVVKPDVLARNTKEIQCPAKAVVRYEMLFSSIIIINLTHK